MSVSLTCADRRAHVDVRIEPASEPMSLCYAYDSDGRRADACTLVRDGQQVPLAAKQCPTWFVPDVGGIALADVSREHMDVRAVRWLSAVEQRVLYVHTKDDGLRFALERSMLTTGDAVSMRQAAAQLLWDRSLAPNDLRAALDAWILATVAPRARNARFGAVAADLPIDLLLAVAGDSERRRDALSMLGRPRMSFELLDAVLRVAVTDPPSRLRVLEGARDKKLGAYYVGALTSLPDPIDLLTSNSKEILALGSGTAIHIAFSGCDPDRRKEHIALIEKMFGESDTLGDVASAIDGCIKHRAQLEPFFRAWLGPKK